MSHGDRYRRVRIVGRGSFGCCWLVQNSVGEHFILKQIDVSKMPAKQKEEAANEVTLLSKLRHPFIINYRESYVEDGLLCIITDYAERGDLYNIIRQRRLHAGPFRETLVMRWFTQMCLAVKHVHDRRILHRDLKTQNIFLSGSGQGSVKIGDFGIAMVLQHTQDCARTAIGTPYYLSPEICQERPYNQKSDIWSLGCVLYEMATLQHAFDAESMRGLVMKILKGVPPPVPKTFSDDMQSLVSELLTKEPLKRPWIDDVLRRPVVRAVISQLLQEVERKRAAVAAGGAGAATSATKLPSTGQGTPTGLKGARLIGAKPPSPTPNGSSLGTPRAATPPGGRAACAASPSAVRGSGGGGVAPVASDGVGRAGSSGARIAGAETGSGARRAVVGRVGALSPPPKPSEETPPRVPRGPTRAGSASALSPPPPGALPPRLHRPPNQGGEACAPQHLQRPQEQQSQQQQHQQLQRQQQQAPAVQVDVRSRLLNAREQYQLEKARARQAQRLDGVQRKTSAGQLPDVPVLSSLLAKQGCAVPQGEVDDLRELLDRKLAQRQKHAEDEGREPQHEEDRQRLRLLHQQEESDQQQQQKQQQQQQQLWHQQQQQQHQRPLRQQQQQQQTPDHLGKEFEAVDAEPSKSADGRDLRDENSDLITTLQEGLNVNATVAAPASLVEEPCRTPTFLRPDGQVLNLPVSDRDSLSYRVEALRVYLEEEIGLDAFVRLHRYLDAASARPVAPQRRDHVEGRGDADADASKPLEVLVPPRAIAFLPLVHQLIVCEDMCFNR